MRRIVLLSILLAASGCWKDDMGDDAHIKPLEPSSFFVDGKTARPLVNGTVPRGGRVVNDTIYAVTTSQGEPAKVFPFALKPQDVQRGQQQYDIFCSPCHGATGKGDGMIVQRGFPKPPSLYLDRLRSAPPGYIYNVIAHGYGAMYSYAERIEPDDRWRIVGYVRALQLSDPNDKGLDPTPATQATK